MTGHQDRPDIKQRRRLTRLRSELGLTPVPPHIGAELRTVAPRVSEQVTRLLRHRPEYLALSPEGQRQLLAAVDRAVDEFARLVGDRLPQAPGADVMLADVVRIEDDAAVCRTALHAVFTTVCEVTRELWPQLPQAQAHAAHLDAALARYAKRLCSRAMSAKRPQVVRPASSHPAGDSHVEGLVAMVEHRWGGLPVQLYLSVSTLGAADAPLPPRTAHELARPLRLVTTDHVVTVTEQPVPTPRCAAEAPPSVVVCVGPVPVSAIALAHDTALLLLRLIRADVAAPPSPVQLHAPNLGFLHPYPHEASVRKIRDLLRPLTKQGGARRSALARTLQVRLRTAATAQGLARQLAMHPQTVHNHLAVLRNLFNSDLDFAEDTLAMQAALDLVLPLWELEAGGRRASASRDGRKPRGYDDGNGGRDLP